METQGLIFNLQWIVFSPTENKSWTMCSPPWMMPSCTRSTWWIVCHLTLLSLSHSSAALRQLWLLAFCHCFLTEPGQQGRVEYSSRGGWDASSWAAEVQSPPRGKPLVWVNTIIIQQRDTLPGTGNFLVCQNNVWHCWLNIIGLPKSSLLSMRWSVLWRWDDWCGLKCLGLLCMCDEVIFCFYHTT